MSAGMRWREQHAGLDREPAPLQQARKLDLSRRLRSACLLLRRSEDGRYVAIQQRGARPCALDRVMASLLRARGCAVLPGQMRRALGIRNADRDPCGLREHPEPIRLAWAGFDRFGRPLWLHPGAARAWINMRRAAARQGVLLDAISGFRSAAYQAGIFRRKLARGQTLEQILAVNAAPGFSEHHSGRALDIGTPGEPPAETSFEHSTAFAWLCRRAAMFGFSLSYPRGNPSGIQYEPWHWCWHPPGAGALALPRGD
jgi:zinc D-Ala-D-Ala carboxypeptidase